MPAVDDIHKKKSESPSNVQDTDSSTLEIPPYKIHNSYWVLQVSIFLLFLSYNCTQSFASTIIGSEGMIAICILYVFYIISNLITPVVLYYFNNDAAKMQAYGTLAYTLFIFTFFLATVDIHWALYPTAALIGLSGGLVWVGNGVFLTSLSAHIAEEACSRSSEGTRLDDVEAPSADSAKAPMDESLSRVYEAVKGASVVSCTCIPLSCLHICVFPITINII